MAESLMFPEINEASLSPQDPPPHTTAISPTALAVVAPDATKIDLAKIDLEAVALAHFEPSRAELAAATKALTGVVHDLSTAGKLAEAKSLRHRLINIPRANARKVSTRLKSTLAAASKSVGEELDALEKGFEATEKEITPQIDARDAEIEAEQQRAEKERKRKQAEAAALREIIDGELAKIRGYGTACKDLPAVRILAGIEYVETIDVSEEARGEVAAEFAAARAETIASMRAMHAEKLAAEQAAAAAEALRLENERKAAELAAQQRTLALQQRRMEDIRRINERCADAQAAIVGQPASDAVTTLETFVSATTGLDVSAEAFGADLAGMAAMAQSMVLAQLRSMLTEAQARAENERKAKQAADDLAAAQAAEAAAEAAMVVMREPDPEPEGEKSARDWPDLQTAELACATTVQSPAIETESEHFSIKITEATPEQCAQRMSPRIDVTFSAEASALLRSNCPQIDVVAAEPEPEPALPALLAHIAKAFDTRFPTQPKPGVEWWAELKRLAGEVRA